jgi:hypothetical protein
MISTLFLRGAAMVSWSNYFLSSPRYPTPGSIGGGSIGKYTISGNPVDPKLISRLGFATIAAVGTGGSVPEPFSTLWLALPVLGIFFAAAGARKFTTA